MTGACSVGQKSQAKSGMDRTILILSSLLMVQLALAVLLKFGEAKYQPSDESAKLLTCDFNAINKIVIEEMNDKDGKNRSTLVLEKQPQGWLLPHYYAFPASSDNISQLLDTLKSLKKGLRVATTSSAAERFKVGPDKFERSLSLFSNNQKVSTLYLGNSPNFKTVYARLSDNGDIYSMELPLYQVSTKYSDWIDRKIADNKPDNVLGIKISNLQIRKSGENWTLTDKRHEHTISKSLAVEVIDKLARVDISSVLGTNKEPEYEADNPVLSYTITLKNGKTITYSFSKPKERPYYVLKLSDKDYWFAVDSSVVKQAQELTPELLLKQAAKQ